MRRLAWALHAALLAGSIARAQPEVALDPCAGVEPRALASALGAERGLDGGRLTIRCSGAATLEVAIELPSGARAERSLDVSDVPSALRARLIAIAVAELALRASAEPGAAPPAAAPAPSPETRPAPASGTSPGPALDAGSALSSSPAHGSGSEAALTDRDPPLQLQAPTRPVAALASPCARSTRRALATLVAGDPLCERELGASARASGRLFAAHGDLLAGLELAGSFGTLELGATALAGGRGDRLGELVTWIAAGFLDAALLRVHADPISVLASARVELGAAGVEPSARAGAQALRQDAPFAAAHAVLRAELSLGEVSLALDGSFGFCAGLIVLADTREIAALDGAVVSWSLGIEGLP